MRILCLNPSFLPRFSRTSRSPSVARSGTIYYPIWLCYAAGALEKAGHKVALVDMPARGMNWEALAKRIAEFQPQMVVMGTSTPSIANDCEVAADIARLLPGTPVVAVGTHVTARPQDAFIPGSGFSIVIRGEYDATVVDLAEALEKGRDLGTVPGISYFRNGELVSTADRPLIDDLDSLPMLAQVIHDHLNVDDYFFAAARYPMIMMITGRGCPNQCIFCVYPQTVHGRRYRLRSPESVTEEFAYIRKHLPQVREIVIEDDTFTADIPRARKISELLIAAHNHIPWTINVRATLDLATMRLMRRAGCRTLVVGFESGDEGVLKAMHKNITLEDQNQFARNAKLAGLLVHGCFMAGTPGETRQTLMRTLEQALKLDTDTAQFFPLMVYPGTEAFAWASRNGYLHSTVWRDWVDEEGKHRCMIDTPELNGTDLEAFCDYARLRYYRRLSYIASRLWLALRRPAEIPRLWKAFWTFLPKLHNSVWKQP
jgi:anaerobic magnesium-protoporphyrin IX monomethyl ester cyclase